MKELINITISCTWKNPDWFIVPVIIYERRKIRAISLRFLKYGLHFDKMPKQNEYKKQTAQPDKSVIEKIKAINTVKHPAAHTKNTVNKQP